MTSHMDLRRVRPLLALLTAVLGLAVAAVGMPSTAFGARGGTSVALARHGAPNATIVWWTKSASPTPAYAASELRSYVRQMSGAKLDVVQGTVKNTKDLSSVSSGLVVVSGGAARRSHPQKSVPRGWLVRGAKKLAGARNDAFAITTIGHDKLVLSGATQRGTLYAAYELLERFGVRFFAPSFNFYKGHSERVPHESTVATRALDLEQEASLRYRRKYVEEGWSHDVTNLRQLIDWMAKQRQNILVYPYDYTGGAGGQPPGIVRYDDVRSVVAPELEKRGMVAEVGGHGFTSWLPPSKYPQYYESGYNVFDITNAAAVQQYVDNVIAYLKARPEIQVFDAWPPDGARWPPNVLAAYGSVVNAQAYLIRQLTHAVEAQLPGVRVEEIGYVPAQEPPDAQYMYDASSNVIDVAMFGRSYGAPLYDPSNAYYSDLFKRWRAAYGGDLAVYEYYRKYFFHSLPVSLAKLIAQDMPYERSLGSNGIGTYSEPADWIPYEITYLVAAKLSWDTSQDAAQYVSDYLRDRYGAAAPAMQTYLDRIEDAARTLFDPNSYADLSAVTQALQDYQAAKQALAVAAASAPDGSASYVIQRLRWSIEFAIADTEISLYADRQDPLEQAQASQQTRELVKEHRFDGVVLENAYTAGRYGDAVDKFAIARMYRSPAFGSVDPDDEIAVSRGSSSSLSVRAQDVDYTGHTVQWTVSAPSGLDVTPGSGSLQVDGAGVASRQVSVSAADGLPDGRYTLTFHFRTEDGTELPDASLAVIVASPGNLAPYYDNVGITDDRNVGPGNIDLFGCSYSAQALAGAGITPGQPVRHDGVTFTWPDVPAGQPDNIIADHQPIAMPSGTSGARLAFLGTGAPGNALSTGWIEYADGTRQYYTVGLPDWQKGDGDGKPVVTGYQDVAVMPYHNCGRYDGHKATYLFMAAVPLQPGREVAAVRLPYDSGRADLHFFDVRVGD